MTDVQRMASCTDRSRPSFCRLSALFTLGDLSLEMLGPLSQALNSIKNSPYPNLTDVIRSLLLFLVTRLRRVAAAQEADSELENTPRLYIFATSVTVITATG